MAGATEPVPLVILHFIVSRNRFVALLTHTTAGNDVMLHKECHLGLVWFGFTLGLSTCMQLPALKTFLVQDRLFPVKKLIFLGKLEKANFPRKIRKS